MLVTSSIYPFTGFTVCSGAASGWRLVYKHCSTTLCWVVDDVTLYQSWGNEQISLFFYLPRFWPIILRSISLLPFIDKSPVHFLCLCLFLRNLIFIHYSKFIILKKPNKWRLLLLANTVSKTSFEGYVINGAPCSNLLNTYLNFVYDGICASTYLCSTKTCTSYLLHSPTSNGKVLRVFIGNRMMLALLICISKLQIYNKYSNNLQKL